MLNHTVRSFCSLSLTRDPAGVVSLAKLRDAKGLLDGGLTYDELYKLAEWRSNHREACVRWPGDLLVKPLQKAWADSKMTKTEARQVATGCWAALHRPNSNCQ